MRLWLEKINSRCTKINDIYIYILTKNAKKSNFNEINVLFGKTRTTTNKLLNCKRLLKLEYGIEFERKYNRENPRLLFGNNAYKNMQNTP